VDKLDNSNLPFIEKTIGEHLYRVTRLDWWGVQDVIEALTEILGPSLESMGGGVDLQDFLSTDTADLLPAIGKALGKASGERGKALQVKLGRQTVVETGDKSVVLDKAIMGIWFSQHPAEALPWLWFALEVQVRDFIEPLIKAVPSQQTSQKSEPTNHEENHPAKGQASPNT